MKQFLICAFFLLSLVAVKAQEDVNKYKDFQQAGRDNIIAGEYEKAVANFDSALNIMEYSSSSYYERGFAQMELKNYSEAIADFSKVIELAPHKYYAYTNRAICYLQQDKIMTAKRDIDKALELDPENEQARELRAEINQALAYINQQQQEKLNQMQYQEELIRRQRRRENAAIIAGTLIPLAFWTTIFLTW